MNFRNLLFCTGLVTLFCTTAILPEPKESNPTNVKNKINKDYKSISPQQKIARTIYGLAAAEFAMLSVSVLSLAVGDLLKDKQATDATQSSIFDKPFHWWWQAHNIALRPIRNVLKGDIFEAGVLLSGGYITYRIARFFAYKAFNVDTPENDEIEAEYY